MQCILCSQNAKEIDYKDTEALNRFVSGRGKIKNPKYTHLCARHQRHLSIAIKRARIMGLMPFVRH